MGRIIAWLFSTEALVAAIAMMQVMAISQDVRALAIIILCIGIVLWCARKAYQNSKPIIIASLSSFVVMGGLTYYVIGPFADYYFGLNPFIAWALLEFVIGCPFMAFFFKKYKS